MIVSSCTCASSLSHVAIGLSSATAKHQVSEKAFVEVEQTVEVVLRKLFRKRIKRKTSYLYILGVYLIYSLSYYTSEYIIYKIFGKRNSNLYGGFGMKFRWTFSRKNIQSFVLFFRQKCAK